MKRIQLYLILLFLSIGHIYSQQYKKEVKPVKNVILMIPDGTSTSVLSAARWYQYYNTGNRSLNIDPYLCGLVSTYSSNAPIPDSAPAMSAYTTGIRSQAGNISVYPDKDLDQDIDTIDSSRAYQPLLTVFEAAKIKKQKATGIVVTTDFCHATPAACASHHYDRSNYTALASQMAYNNIDVVFAGGSSHISDDIKAHLKKVKTLYFEQDINTFKDLDENQNVWGLMASGNFPYDIDRTPEYPSLAEMTANAIKILNQKENGFFLMVEGSRVDMAAHGTDPIGIITEFLAFDKAVGIAMEYAKEKGETAVVVMPDHGNGGLNFGSAALKNYSQEGLDEIFGNISQFTKTAHGLGDLLRETTPENIRDEFRKHTSIDLNDEEMQLLISSKDYIISDYTEVGNTENIISSVAHIMKSRTYFEFISGNHTGEDVFLAAYHPEGNLPLGLNTNTEMNLYLCDLVGLDQSLQVYTKELFAKHTEVFDGLKCEVIKDGNPKLVINKGSKKLEIPAFKSIGYLNGKTFDIGSVVVYIDKNNEFYLPKYLKDLFN